MPIASAATSTVTLVHTVTSMAKATLPFATPARSRRPELEAVEEVEVAEEKVAEEVGLDMLRPLH